MPPGACGSAAGAAEEHGGPAVGSRGEEEHPAGGDNHVQPDDRAALKAT